jgi:hypothetical protein
MFRKGLRSHTSRHVTDNQDRGWRLSKGKPHGVWLVVRAWWRASRGAQRSAMECRPFSLHGLASGWCAEPAALMIGPRVSVLWRLPETTSGALPRKGLKEGTVIIGVKDPWRS